jgi:predicted NBD/HSP70 family sugar kinase
VMRSLKQSFDGPVFIDNEATFAALGEKYFGVARGHNNVLYISAGIGIGGGLIVGGQLYNGASGFASEFGHMTLDSNGVRCGCGNVGCWETLASQAALFRYVRDAITAGGRSSVEKLLNGNLNNLSVGTIVDAAKEGDAVALEALQITGSHLGIGTDVLIKAFNPEIVIFGGRLSLAGEFLLPIIKEELKKRTMFESLRETPVVTAHFGPDAALMGGVAKIFQSVLTNPAV